MDTKETTIYHAVLIAALVIGNIIIYFIISIFRQHRKHQQLYQAKTEAEINAAEKERARIAADLHDDLGPILSAVQFKLAAINEANHHTQTLVASSMNFIDALSTRLRFIANDLMPNSLISNGPVQAIQDFIHHISVNSATKIVFTHAGIPSIEQSRAIHIYRILQEIIHNTIRHAAARRLTINILHKNNRILISAADDGVGFNYKKINNKQTGLGLSNLQNRTGMLGGTISVQSKPGKGTAINIDIPL